jgi:hypothetical protein
VLPLNAAYCLDSIKTGMNNDRTSYYTECSPIFKRYATIYLPNGSIDNKYAKTNESTNVRITVNMI